MIEIIRSSRKTISIQVKGPDHILVRAPYGVSERTINRFLRQQSDWIRKQQEKQAAMPEVDYLTEAELKTLTQKAKEVLPGKVSYYARLVGVDYGRISIRHQKTRWGSCSSKGNLNFNCLLMLMPEEVIDSVVVHELCHRLEMNHSQRFYREVLRVYPEYKKWNSWLKKNGPAVMKRLK